ncbi:protein Hook homolog 3-like [Schistocerca cancellata]|uniref:protein Hook homolog 3-like n=1 Tax=Schistocerca cancellata TaxID=274614 RepID=UPI0021176E26|nr:protein Hook homolog 3-like [Schistocerca cancellata]
MDKIQLCESLMKWLQTFDVDAPHSTVEEVSDGVAMAQALAQIAPEWFTESWLSKIKTDAGSNWRLKVSNLKKVIEGIVDYYHDVLNQHLSDFNKPDVVRIGEKCDAAELGRLLQLILGCAVNCNQKQEYITKIMMLEESVQQVIMQSIQELESASQASFGPVAGVELEAEAQRLALALEVAAEARDQMAQRCHELDMQVTLLQEEKASVLNENKRLHERLREFEMLEGPMAASGHKCKELRKQVDALKEEIFKLETSRDDFRAKVELQEKEHLEMQAKIEDLQKMADEAQHLKDEVDILRETADMVGKYEATIESYKKRLEEVGDLRRQIKILEEKNTDYMQQNMELEEELRKSGTLKQQLEMYKKQVAELDEKLIEETKRADRVEFESKKLQERLHALQRENQRLIIERDSLKETNEELKCSQLQQRGNCTPDTLLVETVPENMIAPEIKEKLLRLQHENKMLKLNQRGDDDEKLSVVQAMLEDTTKRVSQLRADNRLANQRIMELESQLEEAHERDDSGGTGLRHCVTTLQEQLRVIQSEKERLASQLEDLESSINEYKRRDATLQDTLRRKDQELQQQNERYRKYVEKAKDVIKIMDPKQSVDATAEVAVLRSQLQDKEKVIEDLEEEKEQNKVCHELEERLMTSAFYKLSLTLQSAAVDHRIAALSSGQGQSFLARQRQASGRGVVHSLESR